MTPAERLARCLVVIFDHEGGYVDHPSDPGGATNLGITKATLEAWRGRTVTKDQVKALERPEATQIYKLRYWDAIKGDQLPPGVDLAVLDWAVNSGVSRATKALQSLVGAAPDGVIGPKTLAAIGAASPTKLVEDLCDLRLQWLEGLSTWPVFGKGWARRVNDTKAKALAMVLA